MASLEPATRLRGRRYDGWAERARHRCSGLEDEGYRQEGIALIRSMVEKVVLLPRPDTKGLDAVLHGDLSAILAGSVVLGSTVGGCGARNRAIWAADGRSQ